MSLKIASLIYPLRYGFIKNNFTRTLRLPVQVSHFRRFSSETTKPIAAAAMTMNDGNTKVIRDD